MLRIRRIIQTTILSCCGPPRQPWPPGPHWRPGPPGQPEPPEPPGLPTNDKQQQTTNNAKLQTTTNDKQQQTTNNKKRQTMTNNDNDNFTSSRKSSVEASALNKRCWMSQRTQYLGSVVPWQCLYLWLLFKCWDILEDKSHFAMSWQA